MRVLPRLDATFVCVDVIAVVRTSNLDVLKRQRLIQRIGIGLSHHGLRRIRIQLGTPEESDRSESKHAKTKRARVHVRKPTTKQTSERNSLVHGLGAREQLTHCADTPSDWLV